jgi:hypothetical protein
VYLRCDDCSHVWSIRAEELLRTLDTKGKPEPGDVQK